MKKISVIIPVYNKEEYLNRCLDSVCSQTMPPEDVEVICIDDGSTDSSLEILKEYEKNYPNITIIERETNSGTPGTPRNEGIDVATGEYVFFADGDDFMGIEALERMYRFAKENDSDVLLCKFKGVGGRGVPKSMFGKNEANVDVTGSRIIFTLTALKLFRTSLLRNKNIKFPADIKSGEDQPFVMKAYMEADVISVLSDYDYYYAVKPVGEHMSAAYVPPELFYSGMAEVFNSINDSSLSDTRKNKVMSIFLNRHFDFSRTKNFTLNYESEKEEWMHHLRQLIMTYVPESVDDTLLPHIKVKLKLIRNNDLDNLSLYTMEDRYKTFKTRVVHGEIIGKYESLKDYNFQTKDLRVSYKNKLRVFLSTFSTSAESFEMVGYSKHVILNYHDNKKQSIRGVLVHRNSKKERYLKNVMGQSNCFKFKVNFRNLISSKDDVGPWDLFIESEIDGYKLRARVGNNRNPSFYYKTCLSYDMDSFDCMVKPYFTNPFNNLSFDVKELLENSGKVSGKNNEQKNLKQNLQVRYWNHVKNLRKVRKYLKRLIYFRTF